MKHDEFHSLVLRLANLASIRYWNWYNYPADPQEFAILFAYEAHDGLIKQLIDLGFAYGDDGLFRIEKSG